MPEQTHRCPDCGRDFDDASSLVDHALTAHVAADTPAAHLRRPRSVWAGRIGAGVAVLVGLAIPILVVLDTVGVFEKDSAPERPGTEAHKMSVELRRAGEIEEYRSVEPDDGWDAEYEFDGEDFDGSDGMIRSRWKGDDEEVEYETYLDDDLDEAIGRVMTKHGFEDD